MQQEEKSQEPFIIRKANWDDRMTRLLILMVNEKTPLVPSHIRSKAAMYNDIAIEMLNKGYPVTMQKCSDKMKSLMKGL